MGNFITAVYSDFAAISTVTATTAQTAFPVENVTYPTYPNQVYKSTAAAATTQAVVYDFGAARTLNAVMVENINVTSIKIQGNATDSWGAPTYTATLTVAQDTLDGRYKLFHDLSATGFASTGYRYMRTACNTTTTQWGGTAWIVGSIIPLVTITTWTTSTGPGHGRARLQATDSGIKTGGGMEPSGMGNPYARIIVPAADLDTTMLATYDAVMANGEHQPMVFYRNLSSSAETYCCHRVGTVRVDYGGPNHLSVDAMILESYA